MLRAAGIRGLALVRDEASLAELTEHASDVRLLAEAIHSSLEQASGADALLRRIRAMKKKGPEPDPEHDCLEPCLAPDPDWTGAGCTLAPDHRTEHQRWSFGRIVSRWDAPRGAHGEQCPCADCARRRVAERDASLERIRGGA